MFTLKLCLAFRSIWFHSIVLYNARVCMRKIHLVILIKPIPWPGGYALMFIKLPHVLHLTSGVLHGNNGIHIHHALHCITII